MQTEPPKKAHLYLIPTPIGNLEDITLRALKILGEVDLLLCEDTRRTQKLLTHYGLSCSLVRLDAHTESRMVGDLIQKMQQGTCYGLVSDAGTPLICDAGYLLVQAAHRAGLRVCCLPGAAALICALAAAGAPCVPFYFAGFLPHKKGRTAKIHALAQQTNTWVLYESPHRLLRTLKELAQALGKDKTITLAREMTKWHEEITPSTIDALIQRFEQQTPKGECVLVYSPTTP